MQKNYLFLVFVYMHYSQNFLNQNLRIKIDRPLWTRHPVYHRIYPINYGFVPHTIAPDGKEIDAYLLGINEPLETFDGVCIAIIHRTNNDDDKLIVVPEWIQFSDEQIKSLTEFQERFFESVIVR